MYGSKMGILHATSGQWLLNMTDSPSLAYYAVSNFTKISCEFYLIYIAFILLYTVLKICFKNLHI